MNSTASNTKLNMNDTVSLMVIIGGVCEGITQGSTQLQNLIATYVENNDVDDFNEEWILDNVETFPLLSAEPVQLTYDVKQELDISFDEDGYEDTTYRIEDLDIDFDSLQELEDWIAESINDCDYTAEQCKSWDIVKRVECNVAVEIEGDDEFDITAYGARHTVSQFIETPEPTPPSVMNVATDIDFTTLGNGELVDVVTEISGILGARGFQTTTNTPKEVEYEIDTADHEVALGEDTLDREMASFISDETSRRRFRMGFPVYVFAEGSNIGERVTRYGMLDNGYDVAKPWGDA